MDTPEAFPYSSRVQGLCTNADPRGMTAESHRPVFDIPRQPAVCEHRISRLEALYNDLAKRVAQVEEETRKKKVSSDSVDTRLASYHKQHDASDHYKMQETSNPHPSYQVGHRSYQEAFAGGVLSEEAPQKELQEKEEYKKLKEKNKELEAKNKELLAKAIGMHKHSENMNDPSRLSAVLHTYEVLRLRGWEQFRTSTPTFLTYKTGSSIIQQLFAACEEDVHQRINNVLAVLGIPPLNDAMTDSEQWVMEKIRSLLRYSYQQNSELCSKIVMDPPVEAVWNLQESLLQYSEHVDRKDREHWRKPKLLWPIMKCGEQVIVKGVVWD